MADKTGDRFDPEIDIDDTKRSDIELWLVDNFETPFFKLRYILLVPVLVSILGALMMFAVGWNQTYKALLSMLLEQDLGKQSVVLPIVKALDAFLIGVILFIFAFGIYDFFVSVLEPANDAGVRPDWFKFDSTGELKTKLVELVLVILTIQFFEQMVATIPEIEEPVKFLIIPAGTAVLAFSIGFFKWATH
jgi:uncharacterized membrane protein YqhA